MSHLAPIHYKKFEKFLSYVGCHFVRKGKGDHRVWRRIDLKRPIIFPKEKQIPIFIIKNNLRILKIETDKYLAILKDL